MKITNIKYQDKICTFYFEEGKIKKIISGLDKTAEYDVQGSKVSIGWIDSHVHVSPNLEGFSSKADESGIKQGVTTIVDAGSCGWGNNVILEEYAKNIETDLYYLVNLSKNGLTRLDELSDNSLFNEDQTKDVIQKFNRALGIKVRMSSSVHKNNYKHPYELSTRISKQLNTPLVVHIGNGPPSLEELIQGATSKTILCHIYNPKESGINNSLEKINLIKNFISNGGKIDVAHGSASFGWEAAQFAISNDLKPHIISTDIYEKNIKGCVEGLPLTMSKLLYCGLNEEEVIKAVTSSPIKILNIPIEKEIKIGYQGSLTFYKVVDTKTKAHDSTGKEITLNKKFKPTMVWHRNKFLEVNYE